jgi:hypothetical protein
MRLKKGKEEGELLTFGTIALRDAELDTFQDGDLIKVLDASGDARIESGWAIYRYTKEGNIFDIIEQENEEAPAAEVKPKALDNKTIMLNSGDKLAAFHNLNHGLGFEFPEQIKLDFKPSGDTKSFDINWTNVVNGSDVFKYNGTEYPLGLRNKEVYSSVVDQNIATYGLTHYIRVSSHLGYVYWSSHVDYSSDIPSLEKFAYSGKEFVPLAIIKLVYNQEDNTMNRAECQVSHIYRNGVLIEAPAVEPEIPEFEMPSPVLLSTYQLALDRIETFKDGQLVKVLNASDDATIGKELWAIYQVNQLANRYELISVQPEEQEEVVAPAEEVKPKALDNKTIMLNSGDKLAAFHNLNHGLGFEFPEQIKLDFKPSGDTKSFDINWTNVVNGSDVFKYNGTEYPLGLRNKEVYSSVVDQNIATYGLTHYIRVSSHLGYVYWSSHVDYSSDIPSLEKFAYSGKEFVPLAIIKLVYNQEDDTMNRAECQVSHIYRNGVLIEAPAEAPEIPEFEMPAPVLLSTYQMALDRRTNYEDGQFVKVLNASEDETIGKDLWAVYQVNQAARRYELISVQPEEAPEAEAHNYPDALSCDYTVTSEAKHKFSVPDAIKGFRSDIRLLRDFDFNISFDYKTIKFDLVGASPTINISANTKDGLQTMQISPLSLVMISANQGKTIYIPVFKKLFPTVTGDAYYLGNASQQNGVQVFSDGTTDTMQLLMQIRVTVPTDWNNFKHSDITVYKYWKKALGTFDELMDYRIANP